MTTTTTSPQAGLATALEHARRLLERDPALARQQAEAILEAVPRHADTTVVLAAALRLGGDATQALNVVAPLARALPTMADAQQELGLILAQLGRTGEAVAAFRQAVAIDSRAGEAWRGLAESLDLMGDKAGAEAALAQQLRASTRDPVLIAAAAALIDNQLGVAEQRLRDHLADHPADVAALRMLAETGARLGAMRTPSGCWWGAWRLRPVLPPRGTIWRPCSIVRTRPSRPAPRSSA